VKRKDAIKRIPEGIKAFDTWKPVIINKYKTLIISDIHIRYYSEVALKLALEYGYKHNVDALLINGDLNDFYALSYWQKDPTKRDFGEEIEMTDYILESIRLAFPGAWIGLKVGNHEERYDKRIIDRLPEMYKVKHFTYASMINADKYDIEVISERIPLRIGELNIVHGHEFGRMFASPVNPARGIFNKAKVHCLAGHWHRTSEHMEKNMNDKVVGCWSTGCLCDLHPDWLPLNNWNHGFALVELLDDLSGDFIVYNKKIINGKVL
jgi:predicted phosphodiesterase